MQQGHVLGPYILYTADPTHAQANEEPRRRKETCVSLSGCLFCFSVFSRCCEPQDNREALQFNGPNQMAILSSHAFGIP